MTLVRLADDGSIALPEDLRASLSLRSGDRLDARIEGGAIRLVPAESDPARPTGVDISNWIGTGRSFASPEEADDFIRSERDSWD